MRCLSRYTDDTYAQQFGDGRHKFYLEFCCNRPILKGIDTCVKCAEKSASSTLQQSRKFNHGKVNEPIPDNSHIFGGKWYYEGVKKWGAPPSEIIEFAIQYQKEARGEFIVQDYNPDELDKSKKDSVSQEMPRAKQVKTDENGEPIPVKRGRKPKVAPENTSSEPTTTPAETAKQPVKRTRKPKVAADTPVNTDTEPVAAPKKTAPRKKAEVTTPYTNLISNTPKLVTKEVVIPTHIESKLDKIDADGFQIEYIKLSVFEANGSTYLIDRKKNKLYKKIKERPGPYVGRWNPDTDAIITDIPDSDEEN